jgi:hypothetical protein
VARDGAVSSRRGLGEGVLRFPTSHKTVGTNSTIYCKHKAYPEMTHQNELVFRRKTNCRVVPPYRLMHAPPRNDRRGGPCGRPRRTDPPELAGGDVGLARHPAAAPRSTRRSTLSRARLHPKGVMLTDLATKLLRGGRIGGRMNCGLGAALGKAVGTTPVARAAKRARSAQSNKDPRTGVLRSNA